MVVHKKYCNYSKICLSVYCVGLLVFPFPSVIFDIKIENNGKLQRYIYIYLGIHLFVQKFNYLGI